MVSSQRRSAPARLVELSNAVHEECPEHSILLLDRDVLASQQLVRFEVKAGLIVGAVAVDVIVKGPGTARLMHDMANLVGFVSPEATYAAAFAQQFPGFRDDMTGIIQGHDEIVASLRTSTRKIRIASQFETNAPQKPLRRRNAHLRPAPLHLSLPPSFTFTNSARTNQ